MNRILIIIAVIVVVVVAGWGVYYFISNSTAKPAPATTNTAASNPNKFTVQGMDVQILKQGSGPAAKSGDKVTVNYVGTLKDGTKFDSTVDRNSPFTFNLGQGQVIKGFDLGVTGMKAGEQRLLTIPPELGYGANGFRTIPKNATLVFLIQLLKIN